MNADNPFQDTEGTKFVKQLPIGTEFTLKDLKEPTTYRVTGEDEIMELPIQEPTPLNNFIAWQQGRHHAESFECYEPKEIIIRDLTTEGN